MKSTFAKEKAHMYSQCIWPFACGPADIVFTSCLFPFVKRATY